MPVSGCPFSRAGITDPGYSSSVPDFGLDKPSRLQEHFTPMKTANRLFLVALALMSLSVVGPKAEAVMPPPDGGYPGIQHRRRTRKALLVLTTGSANTTAVGWFSLFSNADGSFNTATGAGALLFNTADENTAFGSGAVQQHHRLREYGNGTLALFGNTTWCSKHCCRIFRSRQHHRRRQHQRREHSGWCVCSRPDCYGRR